MLDNLVVERFREGHGNEELKKHLCSAPKAVEQLESHTKGTSLPVNDTNGVATSANLGMNRL